MTGVVDDDVRMDRADEIAVKPAAMPAKSPALIRQQDRLVLEQSFGATLRVEAGSQQVAVQTDKFKEGLPALTARRPVAARRA